MARIGRLKRECQQLSQSPPSGISCWAEDDKLDKFTAVIVGEEDTVYSGGMFKLELEIPERYPFQPPKVRFLTKVYHPNIDTAGRICLDVLKLPPSGSWRPVHNIASVLTSIRMLMASPNPHDPLMTDIAEEYQLKRSQYEATAREWTARFAKDVSEPVNEEELASVSGSKPEKRSFEEETDDESSDKKKSKT